MFSSVCRSVLMFLLLFLARFCSVPIFEMTSEIFERVDISLVYLVIDYSLEIGTDNSLGRHCQCREKENVSIKKID